MNYHSTRLLAAVALVTAAVSPANAQLGRRSIPDVYAITNARIVPGAGPTIEKGTIVIRDGVITAVGATAVVPADARVVDGSGLTVYPGFIDALSNLGVPASQQGGGGRGGGGFPVQQAPGGPQAPPAAAPNSLHPIGLQPELRAIDIMKFDATAVVDALDAARGAGITSTLAAPRDGIFMGQSALINLAGSSPQDMLVRSPVALHVGFTPLRAGGYPNSLMGVFAALRQMLLDAQQYRDLQGAYARNPRGMRRPEADASLAALQPVLSREMPVIMWANTQREIERALDLGAEFGLKTVIAGGEQAYTVADRLKKDNVPVIATLNFPRVSNAANTDDADQEPLRVLRERVEAPKNPGRLAAAGIRLAFTSGGMTGMADFIGNVRKAVDQGMPKDAALRSLTLTPAELFGVSDRLGTIETGKIANLTVVRGDLFDRAARVTHVFIDGRQMAVRAPAAADASANPASGTWTITATFAEGERTMTLSLQQNGERLTGTIQGSLGSADISNASIGSGGDVKFTVPITLGGTSEEANFSGTLTGNVMRGTVQIVGHPNGTFIGSRPGGEGGQGRRPGGGQRPPPTR